MRNTIFNRVKVRLFSSIMAVSIMAVSIMAVSIIAVSIMAM